MTTIRRTRHEGSTERVDPADLLASAGFAEKLRVAQDVLDGGRLARMMREAADGGRGISQQELARRLGISQARISAIERGNGRQGPTYALLKRVARASGLDLAATFRPSTTGHARRRAAEDQAAGVEPLKRSALGR